MCSSNFILLLYILTNDIIGVNFNSDKVKGASDMRAFSVFLISKHKKPTNCLVDEAEVLVKSTKMNQRKIMFEFAIRMMSLVEFK